MDCDTVNIAVGVLDIQWRKIARKERKRGGEVRRGREETKRGEEERRGREERKRGREERNKGEDERR